VISIEQWEIAAEKKVIFDAGVVGQFAHRCRGDAAAAEEVTPKRSRRRRWR
jgi:hypothetical protein